MSITRYNPNKIHLGGEWTEVNDVAVSEAVTPGHLVERFNNSGITRWRKHATAGGATATAVAVDQSMLNLGVDNDYAAGDLAQVYIGHKGSTFWMLIASGQNITYGQKLESAGNGTLRALASGTALFTSLENTGAVVATTRIRVEAI